MHLKEDLKLVEDVNNELVKVGKLYTSKKIG